MNLMISISAVVLGLLMLIWGANRFVASASAIAAAWKISPLLIGVVIIGFGTSTPELLVSVLAAWQGMGDLALGNVFGSNIINIGFVLGATAVIAPIAVHSKVIRQEIPFLLACGALVGWQIYDLKVTRVEASVLIGVFIAFIAYSLVASRKASDDALAADVENELAGSTIRPVIAGIFMALGLGALLVGSRLLVWGSVDVAERLGIDELIIGLTVVALGTSLPELTTSIVAALRKEPDLAIGNVVGSNIFNLLAVTGTAAALAPISSIPPEMLIREWPVMIAFTIILGAVCLGIKRAGRISRVDGWLLLAAVCIYNGFLIVGQSY